MNASSSQATKIFSPWDEARLCLGLEGQSHPECRAREGEILQEFVVGLVVLEVSVEQARTTPGEVVQEAYARVQGQVGIPFTDVPVVRYRPSRPADGPAAANVIRITMPCGEAVSGIASGKVAGSVPSFA